jgi:hypothetical protein
MNMLNGHKEYFHVDSIDAPKGLLTCTQANADLSYVREKGILIETAEDTRYWKAGQRAQFSDIKVGERLREKSHGIGKDKHRVAWEIFLDDESLLKYQAEQKAVHAERMKHEGAPGYVDAVDGPKLELTMFNEGTEITKLIKAGQKVRVAPAGTDRQAMAAAVSASVSEAKTVGRNLKLELTLTSTGAPFQVT